MSHIKKLIINDYIFIILSPAEPASFIAGEIFHIFKNDICVFILSTNPIRHVAKKDKEEE